MSNDENDDYNEVSVGAKLPKKLKLAAEAKAKAEGRTVGAIIRSWFTTWVEDEWPSPPVLPDEGKRRKQRRKKKKPSEE